MDQKHKQMQYGMEGFYLLLFLMLAEIVLESVWNSFAGIPSALRMCFLLIIGIGYFVVRCLAAKISISKSYGFDVIWGGVFALTGVVRIIGMLFSSNEVHTEMRELLLIFWLVYTLVFLLVSTVGFIRFLGQRK